MNVCMCTVVMDAVVGSDCYYIDIYCLFVYTYIEYFFCMVYLNMYGGLLVLHQHLYI